MVRVVVDPGVCQFRTEIKVKRSRTGVLVNIKSECEAVRALSENLKEINESTLLERFINNEVYKAATNCLKHVTCPVPCTVLKAVEAEMGLALKRDVRIEFVE